MKNSKLYKGLYAVILCVPFMMVSCDEETETTDTFSRLFRPTALTASVNGIRATLKWSPVGDGLYSLELSRDKLQFTTGLQVFEVEGAVEYTLDLWGYTEYSARVKAISKTPNVNDSEYQDVTFTTGGEDIFYSVADGEIGESSVLLKWLQGKAVSHIIGSSIGSNDMTINLTAEDISAGQKLIEGLTGLSQGLPYTFKIFNGEQQRGIITISKIVTVKRINQTIAPGWQELGTYYLMSKKGAFTRIRNEGSSGYVIADAFKFTNGSQEIIIDNTGPGVTTVGAWTTSTALPERIGANYFHDGNEKKGEKSITYTPDIPESGYWTVSVYSCAASHLGANVPIDIFAGKEKR